MTKPTHKEVVAEITVLKGQLDRVRRFSMFGDDNRAKIQTQIEVLENNWTDDDIYDTVEEDYQDDAIDASCWLHGEVCECKPSESWEPLCS